MPSRSVLAAITRSRKQRRLRHLTMEALEIRTTPTSLPAGFVESRVTVAASLAGATAMEFSPTGELFVLEQKGNAKFVQTGGTTSVAATITVASDVEHGLLGMTFDPSYDGAGPNKDYVYLYYTVPRADINTPAHNRISRFEVSGAGTQTPTFIKEKILREIPPEDEDNDPTTDGDANHNGGSLHIYNNMLYVSIGDHKYNTVTQGQHPSQLLTTPFGKLLRLNLDGTNPTDNPFYNAGTPSDWAGSIWCLGLRNPFKFDINQSDGRIFINDVGENDWEEIDLAAAGANFGWSGPIAPVWEGFESPPPPWANYRDPLMAYDHSGTTPPTPAAVSITGGVFYPANSQFGSLYAGHYFFTDYRGGFIRDFDPAHPGTVANPDTSTDFASSLTANYDVDLKVDAAGNLYYLSSGAVYRISFVNTPPVISSNGGGATATVSVAENSVNVTTVVGTDAETPAALQYQILTGAANGADGAKFSIDANTGKLSFKTAPNFESPQDANADNTYEVTVQVTDPSGATAVQTISVKVTDVNENPVFATAANTLVSENIAVALNFAATDVDRPAQPLTFSLDPASIDADDFTLSASGALSFVHAGGADFEAPTDANHDNVYSINVQVSDGQGGSATKAFTVTVTDIAPVMTTVTLNASGNVEVRDVANKNDILTLSRSGAGVLITDGTVNSEGKISVTGVSGAVLSADKRSVTIPLATIQATSKPLMVAAGNGDDVVNFDAKNSYGNSPIPTTGLSLVFGVGNDRLALVNDPTANAWTVIGPQSGTVAVGSLGTVAFNGVETLQGGNGKDVFKLTNPFTNSLTSLDGGAGTIDSVEVTRDANFTLTDTQLLLNAQADSQVDQAFALANIETAKLTGGDSDNFLNANLFTGSVILNGGNGNDVLWGGSGNDTLYGGYGNDFLGGGSGDDALHGGNGKDVLVGGLGADILNSAAAGTGQGDDLLIGGTTKYGFQKPFVDAVLAAWSGTATYRDRITLLSVTGVGNNKQFKLDATTVFDDTTIDTLYGGSEVDWYFVKTTGATKDTYDATGSEQVVSLN